METTTIKSLFITETPDDKVILSVDRTDFNALLKLLVRAGLNIYLTEVRNDIQTAVELNCSPKTYWSTLNSMDLVQTAC